MLPRDGAKRKLLRRALLFGIPALVLIPIAIAGVMYLVIDIPDANAIATAESAIVLDRDGRMIGRIHGQADRVRVPLERVPEHLRAAVLAAEDRGFYSHPGISVPSIVRAAFANLVRREVTQGGSTITQQYVKNAFVGNQRSYLRKLKEAVLSLKIERRLSKDEILERYLNTIYLGRGAYGVEAASRTYFGKAARRLSLAEGALLAGMIRGPEALDPRRAPEAARARRDEVLDGMARAGAIGPEEAARAKEESVRVRPLRAGGFAPYFMDDVRRELEALLGPGRVYRGGLRVQTTLDFSMQRAAERAVGEVLDRRDDPDAALVALDPQNGAVRALVGGRDYATRQLNLATQGRRQPGSAFKPFVLAAALDQGIGLRATYRAPARITLLTDSSPWTVSNYDRADYGRVDLVRATEASVNTVYAQLVLKVGPERAAGIAQSAGIRTRLDPVPSIALGTSPVTPLELSAAYATLAARGERAAPHFVERVVDGGGRVLFERSVSRERVMDEAVADNVNWALESVVERGTGRAARLSRPAAGKTGTTENHVDAWFVGYTPNLVTGVWMGYAGGGRTMQDVRGVRVVGGGFPARIWRLFMAEAIRELPSAQFPRPQPIPSPVAVDPAAPTSSGSASPSPSPTKTGSPTATPS